MQKPLNKREWGRGEGVYEQNKTKKKQEENYVVAAKNYNVNFVHKI